MLQNKIAIVFEPDVYAFLHSLRQHGFNEVFLQLLVDQLKLPECLLTDQKTIMNGYSQVIELQIRQNKFHKAAG